MPRPRRPGAPEPKRRSRKGCWPCKARKVKCGEERPSCENCKKSGETCDYSIRLNWDGRRGGGSQTGGFGMISFDDTSQSSKSGTNDRENGPSSRPSSSTSSQAHLKLGTTSGPRHMGPPSQTDHGHHAQSLHQARDNGSRQNASLVGSSTLDDTLTSPGLPFDPLSLNDKLEEAKRMSSSFDHNNDYGLPSKRPRLEGLEDDLIDPDFSWVWPALPLSPNGPEYDSNMFPFGSASTTGSPFPYNFDDVFKTGVTPAPATPSDYRRLSVSSLLSGPQEGDKDEDKRATTGPMGTAYLRSTTYYGIDRGYRDLDIGRHDDTNAITGNPPQVNHRESSASGSHPISQIYDEARDRGSDHEKDGASHYSTPVFVRIPKAFEPLPPKLKDNPMNILYFHHFLSHTAKVLVPHDDPHSNPFRTILPRMALQNDNLLSLLLAYSASHRARLLGHPAPAARIALWVQDIFPALRHALADPESRISDANVATAVMLASLEIICPTAFGYAIPWQHHLTLARELIEARPEGLRAPRHSSFQVGAGAGGGTQVCSFLWSWFAYLDVMGGLSGGPEDHNPAWILDYKVYDAEDDDEIDCIMGFSTACIYVLAKVGALAKRCDRDKREMLKAWEEERDAARRKKRRKDGGGEEEDAGIEPTWTPSPSIVTAARQLEHEIRESMAIKIRPCAHIYHSGDNVRWDMTEMAATNEAYHWAALVTLHRRILGKPREHPDVQEPVRRVGECFQSVNKGGTAEGCLLWPMFMAGCDTLSEEVKIEMGERMGTVDNSGMAQGGKVKRLMERVWDTGLGAERLLTNEFIG